MGAWMLHMYLTKLVFCFLYFKHVSSHSCDYCTMVDKDSDIYSGLGKRYVSKLKMLIVLKLIACLDMCRGTIHALAWCCSCRYS